MAARKRVPSGRRVVKAKAAAKPRRAKPRSKAAARVVIAGQTYDIVIDPDLATEGLCEYSANRIKLAPRAFWRMVDTYLHELLHGLIDGSGLGWMMRRRLKMTKAEWHAFEEDFIVRPMTPALLATLRNAGMLRVPAFLRRHAKAA